MGIRRNLQIRYLFQNFEFYKIFPHQQLCLENKIFEYVRLLPSLNKSRHGLGDVVAQHIGAFPDVPLEVADGFTLVAHF